MQDVELNENFPNVIKRIPDPDGIRTEIERTNCGALGT
jgi:hypothetical protein